MTKWLKALWKLLKPSAAGLTWEYARTPVEWFAIVWAVYAVLVGLSLLDGNKWAAAEVAATISAGGGALLSLAAAAHALRPPKAELILRAFSTTTPGSVTIVIQLANEGTAAAPGVTVEVVVRCADRHCALEASPGWTPMPEQALFGGERRRRNWLASMAPGSAEAVTLKNPECVGYVVFWDMTSQSRTWEPSKRDYEAMDAAGLTHLWPERRPAS
jgi:hypothetical protein